MGGAGAAEAADQGWPVERGGVGPTPGRAPASTDAAASDSERRVVQESMADGVHLVRRGGSALRAFVPGLDVDDVAEDRRLGEAELAEQGDPLRGLAPACMPVLPSAFLACSMLGDGDLLAHIPDRVAGSPGRRCAHLPGHRLRIGVELEPLLSSFCRASTSRCLRSSEPWRVGRQQAGSTSSGCSGSAAGPGIASSPRPACATATLRSTGASGSAGVVKRLRVKPERIDFRRRRGRRGLAGSGRRRCRPAIGRHHRRAWAGDFGRRRHGWRVLDHHRVGHQRRGNVDWGDVGRPVLGPARSSRAGRSSRPPGGVRSTERSR